MSNAGSARSRSTTRSRELLTQTVDCARLRGLRVSGHEPAFMRAEEVVRAGFDELQHINQLALNSW
jgi:hypothetical protein